MKENDRVPASNGDVTHVAVKDTHATAEMIIFGRDRHGIPPLAIRGRRKSDLELVKFPQINAPEAIKFIEHPAWRPTRNRATPAGMAAPATIMETNMAEDVSSAIAALENERYRAMLSGDAGKLDRLLDDRLRHVHSSGHVDSKASWMSSFGRLWQYRSIERQDQTIVPLGDSALVFNTLHIAVQVADIVRKVDARALTVWNKSGGAWRVVAVFLATNPIAKS